MSPEALTADRVYRDLKRQIIAGRFAPGTLIGLAAVAEEVGTSISPVRDALHRLVGERLVEPHGGGGFATPVMTKQMLHQLYSWHADLTRLAVGAMIGPVKIGRFPGIEIRDGSDIGVATAVLTAELFTRIGASSANAEHQTAILSAGERLHVVRIKEGLLSKIDAELEALWNIAKEGNKSAIRTAIGQYHRRRLSKVDALCVFAREALPNEGAS